MEPLTVKQVADRLGLAPSKLYYHVNMLEQHGLLQVVETRMVANMVEKYYQTIASSFRVDPALLTFSTAEGKESISSILSATLDSLRADLMRVLEAKTLTEQQGKNEEKETILLTRLAARMSKSRAEAFRTRLNELQKEFDAADDEETDEPKQLYALTIAFYPTIYFPEEQEAAD
jgi:AcrR family transcriptional regulator